jgi:hypothetical protein
MEDPTVRIAWVLGWAVPEPWFAALVQTALPKAEHVFLAATALALAQLEATGPFDHIVGYSLGSQILLGAPERVSRLGSVALLAPIFAFSAEETLGGRASRTQVRQLARWLARDPSAALQDFYARAGLDVPAELTPKGTAEELPWGLVRLANDRVEPPLPDGLRAWCGADDALLDARKLQTLEPRVRVVAGATHHPAALIAAFTEALT